jgi:uncharacterized glyoxalase superfamily protein PhnB
MTVRHFPTITPYLLYEDLAAAIERLTDAFGFRERLRVEGDDGALVHAEMEVDGDGVVMLGHPGPDYRSPASLNALTVMTHVYVDDVDAHCAHARDRDAAIVRESADEAYGDRRYDAMDLEGHGWSFAQPMRDVAPEEWGAVMS